MYAAASVAAASVDAFTAMGAFNHSAPPVPAEPTTAALVMPIEVEAAIVAEGTEPGKKKRRPATVANDAADLTPEEAKQKATEEGLTLIEANTQTGFLYVYLWNSGGASKAKEPSEGQKAPSKAPRASCAT